MSGISSFILTTFQKKKWQYSDANYSCQGLKAKIRIEKENEKECLNSCACSLSSNIHMPNIYNLCCQDNASYYNKLVLKCVKAHTRWKFVSCLQNVLNQFRQMGSVEEGMFLIIQGLRYLEFLQSSAFSFQDHCSSFSVWWLEESSVMTHVWEVL